MRAALELVGLAMLVVAVIWMGWRVSELVGLLALALSGSVLIAVANIEVPS